MAGGSCVAFFQRMLDNANMPGRDRHPKKDVEKALGYAEDERWTVYPTHSGHVWGVIRCPARICFLRVSSTPRNEGKRGQEDPPHRRQVRPRGEGGMTEYEFSLIIQG